jgi:hypothetical protein
MSIAEKIANAVAARLKSQGHEVKIAQLVEDWDLAEKSFDEFLKGSVLLGLSKLPDGYGNFLLLSKSQNPKEATAHLEVGGNWIWIRSAVSSLVIKDDEPFPSQDHALLISQVNAHVGQKIVAFKLWKPLPHLALEFSDGSVLAIHGDNGQYESWGFQQSGAIGVYTLPGGPIAVG